MMMRIIEVRIFWSNDLIYVWNLFIYSINLRNILRMIESHLIDENLTNFGKIWIFLG